MTASTRYVTEIPDCRTAIYKNTVRQWQVKTWTFRKPVRLLVMVSVCLDNGEREAKVADAAR